MHVRTKAISMDDKHTVARVARQLAHRISSGINVDTEVAHPLKLVFREGRCSRHTPLHQSTV